MDGWIDGWCLFNKQNLQGFLCIAAEKSRHKSISVDDVNIARMNYEVVKST